jgi:N-acylneuraminate cytidylyltransferase/CMP-N,N'-diacetyllegionaminic acid synthase
VILGAVCARGGSRSVPRKALRKLFDRPLIGIAIECGLNCPEIDTLVVSTEDQEIAKVARQYGATILSLRPTELARTTTPKWQVFRHIVNEWESVYNQQVELLVDLDLSVPLRQPTDISKCIQTLHATDAEVVVTAFRPNRNPYFNMVEKTDYAGYRIVKKPPDPVHNRQQAPVVFGLSPAVYVIRRDALVRYDHWSQAKIEIVEIPVSRAWDIDEELDFSIVELLAKTANIYDEPNEKR